ncbi:hypothetical protein BDN71DRAFT_1485350 [Pleurotus eryngii]|uniref:Helitron helicase-like domain-containing protein n=1 Tax=Pleurotus eryngii TaxID=5323 RepID=A0A9P6D1C2_PLEER|nr:hypothetical protein BDN71DRAFT_1485350 [Pleurotus eryngii]
MNIQCPHCSALHWNDEHTYNSRQCLTPAFGTCCNHGKVELPPPHPPPDTLRLLLDADDPQSREFRANIRMYNMALAFMSLGVKQDHSINQRFGGNTWVFRIQGQLHHNSGALESEEGTAPSYAQLYIHDPDVALCQRMNYMMSALQTMLIQHHQYAAIFKQAFEILRDLENTPDAEIKLCEILRDLENTPDAEIMNTEVAMIMPGDTSSPDYCDIVLRCRMPPGQTRLYRIHEGHSAYTPLHYVLLFPFGEHGWHQGLLQGQYSTLLRGGRLFQQLLIDWWALADQANLWFHYTNQNSYRASLFSGFFDALAHDMNIDLHQLGT